jgi:predicted secreted hydrolase
MDPQRRSLLHVAAGFLMGASSTAQAYERVRPRPLVFPADHGAHPSFRTEWWYITAWLERPQQGPCGLQLTFFRSRTTYPDDSPSAFAPTQLLFAHAALSVPEQSRLLHAQRAARAGFGLASAAIGDTQVRVGGWSLERDANDGYRALVKTDAFDYSLRFRAPGPPVLQGLNGVSAKGPGPYQASYYYSRPQLEVTGELRLTAPNGVAQASAAAVQSVRGRAWLDHEWSSTLLEPGAVGWDWIGINLHDGGHLMAFQTRDAAGNARWRHLAWRDARGRSLGLNAWAQGPLFEALRWWQSSVSGARWPVAMRLRLQSTPSGAARILRLLPLLDAQEVDARASTGGFYWEGAVRLLDGDRDDAPEIGRGYLELTGYAQAVAL